MLLGLFAPMIIDIVGSRLGAQQNMISDILLEEAVPVMTADDRIGQIHVFDDGLQLSAVLFSDFPAEDHGDLIGLTDGPIGVQQTFSHPIQRGAAAEDEVVAEFRLGEEKPVLATGLPTFPFGEKRGEGGQPLLTAGQQVAGRQGIGQFLQSGRMGAAQERIGALLKIDVLLAQAPTQPVMLIQTHTGRKRKIRTHADGHTAPAFVIDVEVVLPACVCRSTVWCTHFRSYFRATTVSATKSGGFFVLRLLCHRSPPSLQAVALLPVRTVSRLPTMPASSASKR